MQIRPLGIRNYIACPMHCAHCVAHTVLTCITCKVQIYSRALPVVNSHLGFGACSISTACSQREVASIIHYFPPEMPLTAD